MYLPIFMMMMKKERDLPDFKRFFMPAMAIAGSVFMVIAAFFAHRMAAVAYLAVFTAVMVAGAAFYKKDRIRTE